MPCPRTLLLAACLDPECTGRRQALILAHVKTCPLCAAELETLRGLSAELRALPDPGLEIEPMRWQGAPSAKRRPRRHFWLGWLPSGLAVAASLAAGVGLGVATWPAGGANDTFMAAAGLDVFDPVPPGGLCAAGLCASSKEST